MVAIPEDEERRDQPAVTSTAGLTRSHCSKDTLAPQEQAGQRAVDAKEGVAGLALPGALKQLALTGVHDRHASPAVCVRTYFVAQLSSAPKRPCL